MGFIPSPSYLIRNINKIDKTFAIKRFEITAIARLGKVSWKVLILLDFWSDIKYDGLLSSRLSVNGATGEPEEPDAEHPPGISFMRKARWKGDLCPRDNLRSRGIYQVHSQIESLWVLMRHALHACPPSTVLGCGWIPVSNYNWPPDIDKIRILLIVDLVVTDAWSRMKHGPSTAVHSWLYRHLFWMLSFQVCQYL